MPVKSILRKSKKLGVSGLVICDHDSLGNLQEAIKYGNKFGIIVIPAVEYTTEIGDIIGLFVKQQIYFKDFNKVINAIKEQKGLVVLPHPYKNHKLSDKLLEKVDIIEVWNSRCSDEQNYAARLLAQRFKKQMIVGSDAHLPWEIENAIIDFNYIYHSRSYNEKSLKDMFLNAERKWKCKKSLYINECISQLIKAVKLKRPILILHIALSILSKFKSEMFVKIKNYG